MELSIPDKAKVNAKCYAEALSQRLIKECKSLLPSGFISQQDDASAHMAKLAQESRLDCYTNCSEFIGKDEWPPNSPDANPLDCYVWRVSLNTTRHFIPSQRILDGLKKVLQLIWDQLPQDLINKAILSFARRLLACVKAEHFERALRWALFNDIEHWKLQMTDHFLRRKWGIQDL